MLRIGVVYGFVVGKVGNKQRTGLISQARQVAKMSSSTGEQLAEKCVLAIAQMCSTNDKSANMCQVKELVAMAKSKAATFLCLPECCDFVGENRQQTLALSEPLSGDTMQQYRELARHHKMWLSLGGIHESQADDSSQTTEKIYNAHVIVDAEGEIAGVYRKLHMFDVETPEFRFRESDVVVPGPRLLAPIQTPAGRMGLQICYDVRFAEPSLLLRKAGAQVLTYPSAFAYSTGKAHWEVLLRARAIENQCYVIAPAQVGFHNAKRQSWGHALAISPWGKILADCGGETELAVATVDIDLPSIEPIRRSMPCFNHRRNDIYSLTDFTMMSLFEPTEERMFADNVIDRQTIFYESEHCFAFTNLRCVVEGHVLVSTKRLTPRLNGLTCGEMSDLFITVCKVQRMLEAIYATTSATVTVQDGSDAGQTVPHVHFHVMPRRPGDFGYNDQIYVNLDDRCEDKNNRSISERIEEAQLYRDYLNKRTL